MIMFDTNPEVAVICELVGLILIARGWHALRKRSITVKKPIGFPWQFRDVREEEHPRLFFFTTWGIVLLGFFFILFPFIVEYLV